MRFVIVAWLLIAALSATDLILTVQRDEAWVLSAISLMLALTVLVLYVRRELRQD
jgi:hypothetical protein